MVEATVHENSAIELGEVPFELAASSAAGIRVYALVTETTLHAQAYGGKTDGPALRVLERYSSKPVVAVEMGAIGQMGGSLRCLTWEVVDLATGGAANKQ